MHVWVVEWRFAFDSERDDAWNVESPERLYSAAEIRMDRLKFEQPDGPMHYRIRKYTPATEK